MPSLPLLWHILTMPSRYSELSLRFRWGSLPLSPFHNGRPSNEQSCNGHTVQQREQDRSLRDGRQRFYVPASKCLQENTETLPMNNLVYYEC